MSTQTQIENNTTTMIIKPKLPPTLDESCDDIFFELATTFDIIEEGAVALFIF